MKALTLAALAWGVFAFGAVYPWAFTVLAVLCAAVGALAWRVRPPDGWMSPLLRWLLAALVISVALQLVPLPVAVASALSPSLFPTLSILELRFAFQAPTAHALSIAPMRTAVGLALLTAVLCFFVGLTRYMSVHGSRWLVRGIAVIGLIVAVVGIVQHSFHTEQVYGLWLPEQGRDPFGPFVNRNHFAGWMALALPLTVGLFAGSLKRVAGRGGRFSVFSSSTSAPAWVILGMVSIPVMVLALMLTTSRSGFGALGAAVAVLAAGASRLVRGQTRWVITVSIVLIGLGLIVWIGPEQMLRRFTDAQWSNDRWPVWVDAWQVFRRFLLTGSGYNTYGTAMLAYQQFDLERHYAAAHNDYLQLLAEGGLLIAVPAVLAAGAFVWGVWRAWPSAGGHAVWIRLGAVAALAALATQEVAEFSLQMPGIAVLCAAVAAIAVHTSPRKALS